MNALPVRILLMEDDPGDVELILEALRGFRAALSVDRVGDGEEGMRFLRRQGEHAGAARPDLILLDLNMPRMDGREVLSKVKGDAGLRSIPVLVLTTSDAPTDIAASYDLGANCFLKKPLGLDEFLVMMRRVEEFWLSLAMLPPRPLALGGRP